MDKISFIGKHKKTFMKILPAILICTSASYLFFENNFPVVTEYICESERIPENADSYGIVHLSDIHNTQSDILKKRILECIEKITPDIIVITGDLIDKRRTDIDTAVGFAEELTKLAPVYFVMGNHEAAVSNFRTLEKKLEDIGVRILHSESEVLDSGIILSGIDDINNIKGKSKDEKIQKALNSLKRDEEKFTILLSHRPELFDNYCKFGADLVLTGHAHGGQMRLPVIGGLYSPGESFFPEYESGMHEKDGTKMIISRGIGNSSFPFRINNRPEIVSIRLKCK